MLLRRKEDKTKKLLKKCEEIISRAEINPLFSAKEELIKLCEQRCRTAKEEISAIHDEEKYNKLAYILLSNYCFDLLSSGKYHVTRGVLSPVSSAENLLSIYNYVMTESVKAGYITENQRLEQIEYLQECIQSVG